VQGGTIIAKPVLDDDLWNLIKPLIPIRPRKFRSPGRKPVPSRACLTGVLFVLRSGMTCWRRLRDWRAAGVWEKLHRLLLNRLHAADQIDWSRALVDSSSVRAVGGAPKPGPTPPIAAKKAANITSSPMPTAFRWPPRSPGPTLMT
jgi:transposase